MHFLETAFWQQSNGLNTSKQDGTVTRSGDSQLTCCKDTQEAL